MVSSHDYELYVTVIKKHFKYIMETVQSARRLLEMKPVSHLVEWTFQIKFAMKPPVN